MGVGGGAPGVAAVAAGDGEDFDFGAVEGAALDFGFDVELGAAAVGTHARGEAALLGRGWTAAVGEERQRQQEEGQ